MSAYIADYPRYAWQLLNGFRVNHERIYADLRRRDLAAYLNPARPLQVLDLANGRLRPQYTLLKAEGHNVYGIDLANRPETNWRNQTYRLARWSYRRNLKLLSSIDDETLICGDVGALPFPNEAFDLVTSIAAFEHLLAVPTVVAELQRVMRPGSLVWVSIHLFTSLSGGHNLSFTQIPTHTVPDWIDPWDHLRRRKLPFHVPLNEWRKNQFLETFANHFEILDHYCAIREGEHLLTPALKAELSSYSRDELTCRDFVIVACKRS